MNAAGTLGKKRQRSLLCLYVVVILIAGLWPFNFRPKNEVAWLNGRNGLHFGRRGIAFTKDPVYGPGEAIRQGRPLSIELVVRPAREPNYSVPRILTLYARGKGELFTIAQWRTYLVLRAATRGNNLGTDFREMSARNALMKDKPRFLTVVSQDANTRIYVNGRVTKAKKRFALLAADFDGPAKLVLGNSATGHSPWRGDLSFLACYDRELSPKEVLRHFREWFADGLPKWSSGKTPRLLYVFDERAGTFARNQSGGNDAIFFPATFQTLKKSLLRFPREKEYFHPFFLRDVAINILGFLPFGFLFAAWLSNGGDSPNGPRIFLITLLGGGLSLAIEVLQIYLPTRTSSLSDVICNVAGTLLGVYLYRWAIPFLFFQDGASCNQKGGLANERAVTSQRSLRTKGDDK